MGVKCRTNATLLDIALVYILLHNLFIDPENCIYRMWIFCSAWRNVFYFFICLWIEVGFMITSYIEEYSWSHFYFTCVFIELFCNYLRIDGALFNFFCVFVELQLNPVCIQQFQSHFFHVCGPWVKFVVDVY